MTKHEELFLNLCNKLYDKWTIINILKLFSGKSEPKEHTVERISRAITGVSNSLESMLPISLRKKRTAYLRMTKDEKLRVTAEWYESISSESYKDSKIENFEIKIIDSGEELGELTLGESETLSEIFINYLFTDKKPFLPNYLYIKKEDNSIWFEWLPPIEEIIEEKLKDNY